MLVRNQIIIYRRFTLKLARFGQCFVDAEIIEAKIGGENQQLAAWHYLATLPLCGLATPVTPYF